MSSPDYRESEPFTEMASGPLVAWRRHWIKGVAAALIGTALGVAAGFAMPVTYTAESRVAVGAGDLTSGAVAGFPIAASGLASNYARYINDRGIAQTDVPEDVKLAASQIPESNVVRIEAVSVDAAAATAAANMAADQLVSIVNNNGRQTIDEVLSQYTQAARNDAQAQTKLSAAQHDLSQLLNNTNSTKSEIRAARDNVTKATAAAALTSTKATALRQNYVDLTTGTRTAANLMVIRTADSVSSSRMGRVAQLGLLGLIVGAAGGLVIAVQLERRRTTTPSAAHEKATGPDGS
ncbi:MAG: hypothetical protein QM695_10285 [Micropruina sp.]